MPTTKDSARFSNPLVDSSSPYLRQHAHNPVFWYPWGVSALERARAENKPILLSIGYSTCYWCHVMEREVFENSDIAMLMNKYFINIKIDREQHPALDDIYMVARQLLTQEGGWPNNVFLTPDLKPFYAGGTYGAAETYGKPGFPRLIEWLHQNWAMQEEEVRRVANNVTESMQFYLQYKPAANAPPADIAQEADKLFAMLKEHYDERSGGFFQAPKFPHECYLQFLLGFYESTGNAEALTMATNTLGKMAAGGIYDHVGCGFHRYAVDKEWYVPHFEKMLYNQAQLARAYTDATRLSGSEYFADIAKSILDFVGSPFTDGNGAFFAAFDAETDGVEGAYYAWTVEELQALLTADELAFFKDFYALADIPTFPGHKHTDGQVIVARQPLDIAAREKIMPYVQLAAMSGQVMNKLLKTRNQRKAPLLDDKIIVSWNGMVIDAFAHAGKIFNHPEYIARARKAADFLLEKAIDNDGKLYRIYASGRAEIAATLEDYAFLIRGLLTLWRAAPDADLLDAATSLFARAEELFSDTSGGYFYTQAEDAVPVRIKSGDDSAIPGANATMLHNLTQLADITGDAAYRAKARKLADFFLGGNQRVIMEFCTMVAGALKLEPSQGLPHSPLRSPLSQGERGDVVAVTAFLSPPDARAGDRCEVVVGLEIREGWHINAHAVNEAFLIPTQLDIQGEGVELLGVDYPQKSGVYEGKVTITARIKLGKTKAIRVLLRFQPCRENACEAVRDMAITL